MPPVLDGFFLGNTQAYIRPRSSQRFLECFGCYGAERIYVGFCLQVGTDLTDKLLTAGNDLSLLKQAQIVQRKSQTLGNNLGQFQASAIPGTGEWSAELHDAQDLPARDNGYAQHLFSTVRYEL